MQYEMIILPMDPILVQIKFAKRSTTVQVQSLKTGLHKPVGTFMVP